MAVSLLGHEVSDLCLGKPALRCVSVSATIGEALSALKKLAGESYISVWSCSDDLSSEARSDHFKCRCIGKICMVDIICFLSREENISQFAISLKSPVSVLIDDRVSPLVRHLEPHASLSEAIDLILDGAQNLVIPIETRTTRYSRNRFVDKARNDNCTLHKYCWLTPEDIIRYLLNSIGLFNPTPSTPINTLNAINTKTILAVGPDDSALSMLPLISQAQFHQSSVAIIDCDGKLIGEISPLALNSCDETIVAAIATLSASELMSYIDSAAPPEDLVQLIKDRLEEHNLGSLMECMDHEELTISSSSSFCSSSSDDEFGSMSSSSSGSGKSGRLGWRLGRRSEAIVCYPWSSLVAVIIQALAHRVTYVWAVEDNGRLAGIVTFASILKVFRERLRPKGLA